MTPAVVVLELNELAPHLVRRWVHLGLLPGFARLFDQSVSFTTEAREAPGLLEPWIQWVTVHSGLDYEAHQVYERGTGHRLQAPRLWDMVTAAGGTSWICGSMNTGIVGGRLNGALVPDLASTQEGFPAGEFDDFLAFLRSSVFDAHAVPQRRPTPRELTAFTRYMLANGLSKKAMKQALRLFVGGGAHHTSWDRAMLRDRLLWDLFQSRWSRLRPHLATVFLDSAAQLHRSHWHRQGPESMQIKPTADEQVRYSQAVLEAYKAMDEMVSQALRMVDESAASLVLVSALNQQPVSTTPAPRETQIFRAHDPMQLLGIAGVEVPAVLEPGRGDETRLVFESIGAARKVQQALSALQLGAEPLLQVRLDGHSVYMSCAIATAPPPDARITARAGHSVATFREMFRLARTVRSGSDQREGLLLVRPVGGGKARQGGRVPLRQVAPTLAALTGMNPSDIAYYFELPPLAPAVGVRTERRTRQRDSVGV